MTSPFILCYIKKYRYESVGNEYSMNNEFNPIRKNNVLRLIFILISLSGFSQSNSKNEPAIQGKLLLDSIWEPVVYLSHIPTFNDMHTMSNEMIIAESEIDTSGFFSFSSNYLPVKDNLFRLHISKKGAPAASMIIGGKEENHIFFITNNKAWINISNEDRNELFKTYTIGGYLPNQRLQEIDQMILNYEAAIDTLSSMKKEFLTKSIHEKLRLIADTTSHPIVSLYALNLSKFESTYLSNQGFYKSYLKKWGDENSTYFQALRAKLPNEDKNKTFLLLIIGAVFFLLGLVFNYYFSSRRKRIRNELKLLSVQERKILELIKSGSSNKEISEKYNISLSTVKSHVSSIYSKLNVKSRKEAMDFR